MTNTDETQTTENDADPDVTTRRLEHLESIETLNKKARVAETDWLLKKENTSVAKKLYDSLMKQVSDLIAGGPATPLFDHAEGEDVDGDWRDFNLGNFSEPLLSGNILDKLAKNEPPIITIGDLSDWQKKVGETWAQAIPGIGEKARAEIEEFQLAHMPSGDEAETAQSDAAAEEQAA